MTKPEDFATKEKNTWCAGCTNFGILVAAQQAMSELANEKIVERRNLVGVTGVGCHAKIFDYLDVNGFYSLHGRAIPVAVGLSLGNPNLKPMAFVGDGDALSEGVSHFIYACRHNVDMAIILHDNQVFALTTGQATPVTEKGFRGKTTPQGNAEMPINPLALALAAKATFIARTYALDIPKTKAILKAAIAHRGIALVEVMQPCISLHDTRDFVKEHMYWVEGNNTHDYGEAQRIINEWDYNHDENARIAMGIFYGVKEDTFTEKLGIR